MYKYLVLFLVTITLQAQVGIGTITPNTSLDVNGDIAWREGTALTLANGPNLDITLGTTSFVRITGPTAAFSISGFQGGVNGKIVNLVNTTLFPMTITHNSVSTPANRIYTPGWNPLVIDGQFGTVSLQYNSTLLRWVVVSYSDNESSPWTLNGNAGTVDPSVPVTYGTSTIGGGENWIGTTDAQDLVLGTNTLERFRIASTGNVGIGDASPAALLTVGNGDLFQVLSAGTVGVGAAPTAGDRLSVFGNASYAYAISGYTTGAGAGVYGQVSAATNSVNGAVEGNYLGSSALGAGVRGYYAGTGVASSFSTPNAGVSGKATAAGVYRFGVHGTGPNTSLRSGGILGTINGTTALGALGYYSSAGLNCNVYGFGQAYTTGVAAGKHIESSLDTNNTTSNATLRIYNNGSTELAPDATIGLGIYGGVMGGWVRGLKYGFHTKGETYGIYVDGSGYTNKPFAYLAPTSTGNKVAAYMSTALEAEITAKGKVNLAEGKVFVAFADDFKKLISNPEDMVITATPQGSSEGVFIDNITNDGFWIYENKKGQSNVKISWIAVTTIKGQENLSVPSEILRDDFDKKMEDVMFNDNNTVDTPQSIWWDGSQIRWDTPQVPTAGTSKEDGSRIQLKK